MNRRTYIAQTGGAIVGTEILAGCASIPGYTAPKERVGTRNVRAYRSGYRFGVVGEAFNDAEEPLIRIDTDLKLFDHGDDHIATYTDEWDADTEEENPLPPDRAIQFDVLSSEYWDAVGRYKVIARGFTE